VYHPELIIYGPASVGYSRFWVDAKKIIIVQHGLARSASSVASYVIASQGEIADAVTEGSQHAHCTAR
jgi:hypothetical protein